jgi:effector-binding domain-containing protein
MNDTPKIVTTEAVETAVIRMKVTGEEMRQVMGPGIQELMAVVGAQGITAGPWFNQHHSIDDGVFDLEIGIPVTRPVEPTGRVVRGSLPAGPVARTIYRGGYEGLHAAWPELDAWVVAQGKTPGKALWQVYSKGPESSPDPAKWETELNRPLA